METVLYCWADLLITSHAEALISGLVRRGMAVQPLAANNTVIWTGDLSCLCALDVRSKRTFAKDESRCRWLIEHVKDTLREVNAPYYSLIVNSPLEQTCTWTGPSISAPSKTEPQAQPLPEQSAPTMTNPLDDALDSDG